MTINRPVQSEKALLSICMNHPEKADEVISMIHPSQLDSKNRKLYIEIKGIVNGGGEPTLDTLLDSELAVYASELHGIFAAPNTIEFHAKKVHDHSTRVKLRELYGDLPAIIEASGNTTDDMVSAVESKLLTLMQNNFHGYIDSRELMQKTVNRMEDARNNTVEHPKSGIHTLDAVIKYFAPTKLYILGARPGTGKTALTVTMMRNMAKQGFKVGMFSAEMEDVSIAMRYLSVDSDMPVERIENGQLNNPLIASIDTTTNDEKIFINDAPNISLSALMRDAKTMKRKENIDALFVDYISLITLPDSDKQLWEKVGIISKSLKQLARELEIPVIALSQLTRESHGNKPTLAGIRHSGSIEEDADCVMFLHDESAGTNHDDFIGIDCIVAKNRGGIVGEAKMMFRKSLTKFYPNDKKD